jgi:hypothetical protein
MQPYFSDLTMTAQTAYAQLLDATLAAQHVRSVADLSGSFNEKIVKGRTYWYYQYTEPSGRLRQIYVGPDSPAVHALIERKSQAHASEMLPALASSAIALGCQGMIPRQYRVINRLAEYGFCQAGGVLIGTHAFLAYGNMLGVRWGGNERTQDIDFAHAGKSVSLLLPSDVEVKTDAAIASLEMGFLPMTGLTGKAGGTYLIPNEPDFRIDFLTTLHRDGDTPFVHPKLGVTLQPLPFMEFSLEAVEQAVVFCREGSVVVNVPNPARYCLHKIMVFGERTGTFRTKANKDLAQAACLAAYLFANRRNELASTKTDLLSRGRGWTTRYRAGVKALCEAYPALEAGKFLAQASR